MGFENSTRAPGKARSILLAAGLQRILVFGALASVQVAIISYLFYFPTDLGEWGEWSNPVFYAKKAVQFAILAFLTFLLVMQPRRVEILSAWASAAQTEGLLGPVLRSVALFVLLAVATVVFTNHAAASAAPPWAWFWAYCGLLGANGIF